MSILIAVAAIIGSTVVVVLIGQSAVLGSWIKVALLIPTVLFVVYCLARIPSKEDSPEKARKDRRWFRPSKVSPQNKGKEDIMGKIIRAVLTVIVSIAALVAIKMLQLPSWLTVLAVVAVLILSLYSVLTLSVGKATPDTREKAGLSEE
jgi:uncharacterized membrane protein